MTNREELLRKLEDLVDSGIDIEEAHSEADLALLRYINDPTITEAYNKIKKWYS